MAVYYIWEFHSAFKLLTSRTKVFFRTYFGAIYAEALEILSLSLKTCDFIQGYMLHDSIAHFCSLWLILYHHLICSVSFVLEKPTIPTSPGPGHERKHCRCVLTRDSERQEQEDQHWIRYLPGSSFHSLSLFLAFLSKICIFFRTMVLFCYNVVGF